MTCRRPFQAIATELRAERVDDVRAMDLEAADELQTTPLQDFARARMQEIYHKIGRDLSQEMQDATHGDAPEHSRIHSCATRHLVHRFIGMFSTLSKMILNDENEEDCADLHYKCKCITQELRTKRDGSTVAAAEHDLIDEKISDISVAKHINIVFEQLATEAHRLATWAEHHRQESSDYFKRIREISIEEIYATWPQLIYARDLTLLQSTYAKLDDSTNHKFAVCLPAPLLRSMATLRTCSFRQ